MLSPDQKRRDFKQAIQRHESWLPGTDIKESYGFSNSARLIEGGLFVANVNLRSFLDHRSDQLVLVSSLTFPPEDELFFAVFVRSELPSLEQRLREMVDLAGETVDGIKYNEKRDLNNTKVNLASDGRLYTRNAGFWERLELPLPGPAPAVDRILFAIYPPQASARRSLLARDFVGYLGELVGHEKVQELQIWSEPGALGPDMQRLPASIPIGEIEEGVAALGGHYPGGEVRRLHAALNFHPRKHFVILSGLSGTGKTQLALQYARAVHGLKDRETDDPLLFVCPVRPEWTDPTGLTGYYDVLTNRYNVPPFLEAVLVATAQRHSPVFVVLDEMNLARVEYYLSDVLSAIETGAPIPLHAQGVPIEGTTGTTIRAQLHLPTNLFLVGTINIDETTNAISDKVLDRASIIDMSTVDVGGFIEELARREPALAEAAERVRDVLTEIHALLSAGGLGFGYRTVEEFIRYFAFATTDVEEPENVVVDSLIVQKILPRLRGTERQRNLLATLATRLQEYPRSTDLLARLRSDLDDFGSFQATR